MALTNSDWTQLSQIQRTLQARRYGIMGQAPQVKTAVLVPLLEKDGIIHVLFTKRALTLRRQPGEISFPGGHRDEQDVDEAWTAIREASEELGVSIDEITLLGPLDVLVAWSGLVVYPYVGVIRDEQCIKPSPSEVAEVFTVPLPELLSQTPDVYDVALQPKPPEEFPFDKIPNGKGYHWRTTNVRQYFYAAGDHVIWGLTARILAHFLEVVRGLYTVDESDQHSEE